MYVGVWGLGGWELNARHKGGNKHSTDNAMRKVAKEFSFSSSTIKPPHIETQCCYQDCSIRDTHWDWKSFNFN